MFDLPDYLGCRAVKYWFVCRESVHFLAAALIGGAARLIGLIGASMWVRIGIGVLLLGIIITKEILEDRVSQNRKKTICDVLSWTLGYLAVTAW